MDLMSGYLLIVLVLFAGNISLLLGNYKINNQKLIIISTILSIIVFVLINTSNYINIQLLDYFSYVFLITSVFMFLSMIYCIKNNDITRLLCLILLIFIILTILISTQTNMDFFKSLSYSLFIFIILFIVYQLTKLLHHAKRQYSVLIGEYMCLSTILIFIFALTYNSTINLDYTAFSAFLILTPTYQLIYVIIGIIIVLIAGVLVNDYRGKIK
ncbi:MAG: peptide ABC transporter permease [Methanobrevibacter thaueri]|nr:peptide ABC transporter permease [Methanobrevibacter thaueri]